MDLQDDEGPDLADDDDNDDDDDDWDEIGNDIPSNIGNSDTMIINEEDELRDIVLLAMDGPSKCPLHQQHTDFLQQ